MGEMSKKVMNWLIMLKVYAVRMSGYANLLNSLMLILSILLGLKNYGIDISVIHAIFILVAFIVLFIIFGKIEYKFVMERELKFTHGQNPVLQEILSNQKKIIKRLENVKLDN